VVVVEEAAEEVDLAVLIDLPEGTIEDTHMAGIMAMAMDIVVVAEPE
jgi:hypothetical protein